MKYLSLLLVLCTGAFSLAGKVAVWDPVKGTSELRFTLDPKRYDEVAKTLADAGVPVDRVTTDQIAAGALSADVYDSFVLVGPALPRSSLAPLKKFADAGGVVISLESITPFLVAIETNPDGTWTMSPKTPTFAWQTSELLQHFGMEYVFVPAQHDNGVRHEATPLFRKYLPDAPAIPVEKRASRWIVPHRKPELRGTYYPLIRSWRSDDVDTVPQIAIATRDGRHAIFSNDAVFTQTGDSRIWPMGGKTLVAITRVAEDLRNGRLKLADGALALDANMPLPEPLAHRRVVGEVSPVGAESVVRFGKFDGSSLELARTSEGLQLPRRLDPGQRVTLDLPPTVGKPLYLRARISFLKSGPVLHATVDGQTVISERMSYFDATGQGNYQAPSLQGVAAEVQRVAYVGNRVTGKLEISNPGTEPLYFDAVQLETHPDPARPMIIGLGAGQETGLTGRPSPIARAISETWPRVRGSSRLNNVGPPEDPDRWKVVDRLLGAQLAMTDHLEVIIEGTPEWAAISPDRYEMGRKANRPHTVPPDPVKYAQLVRDLIERYGDKIASYEIWNEANIVQFYRGTPEEFATLHNAIVKAVREGDPTATVIAGGMAGVGDAFFTTMHAAGAWSNVDQIAIHPYAGTSPAWDIVYGQLEGELYSQGIATQIYSNESGFPHNASEWFKQKSITPQWQAMMIDKAMSRLLAGDVTRLNVFHAGGGANPFGLFNEQGKPRPAYGVFDDYLQLALNGGKQFNVAIVSSDGKPLDGIFAAGAKHDDGSITVVVSPSQRDDLRATEQTIHGFDFKSLEGWTAFGGKAQAQSGTAILTPDAGKTMGFYAAKEVDPTQTPSIRVTVNEVAGSLSLVAVVDKHEHRLHASLPAGTTDIRLPAALVGPTLVEFKFRATGRAILDRIDLLDPAGQPVNRTITTPPTTQSAPVALRFPAAGRLTVESKSERPSADPTIDIADGAATVQIDLTSRTVLRFLPLK